MHTANTIRSIATFIFATAITIAAHQSSAQHTTFTLLGDPNPAAASTPSHRKAVHPISSPYFHEDSFITNDVRAWFLYHDFPNASVIDGGNAKVYAAQLRLAITNQLQLVAYKDGYTDFDSGLLSDDGTNDIAAGLKWAFLQDFDNQLHAAAGVGYEFKTGDGDVLQNSSDLRLWTSVNKGFENLHLGFTANLHISDDGHGSFGSADSLSWHIHADYYACQFFSPVIELNGYHTINEDDLAPLPFQGIDVASLGGGKGEDVVTIAFGSEIRPCDFASFRFAYETPLTDSTDLFGYRWTFSMVIPF